MNQVKQYGFKEPVITQKNWVLGGFSKAKGTVINPSGNWQAFRPNFEPQSIGIVDTDNCTGFGTLHAIEAQEKFLLGGSPDYAPRAVGIAAGTSADGGNDPTKVADAIRNITCVMPESVLPFTPDLTTQTYYTPKPLPANILSQGQPWANKYDLQYELVFTGGTPQQKKDALKLALQRGTVCVSVYAWNYDPTRQLYVKPQGAQDTHWVFLECYDQNDCPRIFDSYADNEGDPSEKILDPLFDFGTAIVYYLVPAQPKISILAKLLDLIGKLLHMDELLIQNRPDLQPAIVNPINVEPPPPAPNIQKYTWNPHDFARNSSRIICDEEGLSLDDKNILTACIEVESGFNPKAIHKNTDPNGKLLSTDWGIVQVNDFYHIGIGKDFPSVDYVLNNPEICVRWMARLFKSGKKDLWTSYSSGAYKKFL